MIHLDFWRVEYTHQVSMHQDAALPARTGLIFDSGSGVDQRRPATVLMRMPLVPIYQVDVLRVYECDSSLA